MDPRALVPAALAALALAACGGAATPGSSPWFREVARERGLDWTHVRGPQRYWFPEIMGGGVGLLDFDGDGALDVYLVQSGDLAEPSASPGGRLFRNLGAARFEEAGAEHGARDTGYGMGCACGDADQDGDTDLFVTRLGPDALWRNDGGVFADATASAGVGDPGWGTSALWLDVDADGDLDLAVANYVRWSRERELVCRSPQGPPDYCSPLNYDAPTRATLYRNEGDGRFTDVSERAGLSAAFGNGLGVVGGDLDDDGRADLYVANDMTPNQLWQNRGDGTFVDRALLAGCAVNKDGSPEAGMGTVAVDADDDGDLDLFITHLRDETNTFYQNLGGRFRDHTGALGLAAPSLPFTGFGVGFQDFDRDGVLDLYVANGAVTRNRTPYDAGDPYGEPDLLFRGRRAADGALRFEELLPRGGTEPPLVGNGRGAAFGDLDEDGDVDAVVVDNGQRVRLLENVAPGGHWLSLRLRERAGGDALGARATLVSGGTTRYRWAMAGGSYCSSGDPRILCGLGAEAAPVTVTVRWSDAGEERFGPLDCDRKHELRRGQGQALPR